MNIEGTPHERATLVTFAYIAGFTAAFIAFGDVITTPTPSVVDQSVQVAAVQSAATPTSQSSKIAAENVATTVADMVVYQNDGLYVYSETEFPTLLSKLASAAGVVYNEADTIADMQGFHTALPYYQHIEPLSHVLFCEQYNLTGECTPYLYDLNTQILHVFQVDDEPLVIDNRQVSLATVTSDGSYVIGQYRSISPSTPWILVVQ